jgi:hypothetical protein
VWGQGAGAWRIIEGQHVGMLSVAGAQSI